MKQFDELEFWIDLNLPPKLATWLIEGFNVNAKSFKELLFTDVPDIEVYRTAARKNNMVIITTKDIDFSNYQKIVGSPPRILYLNIGNISNKKLKLLIEHKFEEILHLLLTTNDALIEISKD